ncbi:DNA repair protein RAD50 [Komagataella phaffii GS115]|uniref:DNA repair protein RAD50 n=1 Tax=Komagataella phaffii (strain GS115 / ATCC 20864) TaxID=644223 RepID=C4QYP1_KOMPG|nr:DNA repair protein RAD50 [Komagataella phaffii GS115]CAY68365.1 DNA repair protein RAD50 [Komagataella phaffii GS115]
MANWKDLRGGKVVHLSRSPKHIAPGSPSSIYKLAIQGVRSFDPHTPETIQFSKPLTLIVGQNGSGKTTIIECLKYATTGDLPPNSKGGAFVHDPKIAGDNQVKAQVKLAFQNISGVSMILTKTLQVVQKPGKSLQFKTLENQLSVINNGERTRVSQKAAEIESLIPNYLGVSKAVLNYVIFCHQEENLWPISEPMALKKKFDEIFDSVKFIKVLEGFKGITKDMSVDIKLLTNNVEHLKNDKKRADLKRAEMEALQNTVEDYNAEIIDLNTQVEEVTRKLDELFKSNQDFEKVLSKLDFLATEKQSTQQQIDRLFSSLTVLPDSTEILENNLSNYGKLLTEKRVKVNEQIQLAKEASESLNALRDEYSDTIKKEGELRGLESTYKNYIQERIQLIQENASLLGMTISETTISSDEIEEASSKASVLFSTCKKKLDLQTEHYDTRIHDLNLEIGQAESKLGKEEERSSYLKNDINSLKKRNQALQKSINDINSNESEFNETKEDIERLTKQLEDLRSENKLASINNDLKQNQDKILVLENELDQINKQIITSNRQGEVLAKLHLLKENTKKGNSSISKLVESYGEQFKEFTGEDLNPEDCLPVFLEVLKKRQEDTDLKRKEVASFKQNEYESNHDRSLLEKKLEQSRSQLQECRSRIVSILEDEPIEEYESIVKDLESDYEIALQNSKLNWATKNFNETALKIAKEHQYCILCKRELNHDELGPVMVTISENIEKANDDLYSKEKDRIKQDLDDLKSIRDDISNFRNLEGSIASANDELNELKTFVSDDLARVSSELEQLESDLVSLESLRKHVVEISKLQEDLSHYYVENKSIESELSAYGVPAKTLSELQEDLNGKNFQLKELRRQADDLKEQREFSNRELSMLEGNVKDKRLLISNFEKSLMIKLNLEKGIDENKARIDELQQTGETVLESMKLTKDRLNKLKDNVKTLEEERDSTLTQLQSNVEQFKTVQDSLVRLNSFVNKYELEDEPILRQCEKNSEHLKASIKDAEGQLNKLHEKVNVLEKQLSEADTEERNIKFNLDLRSLNKELVQIEESIESLDRQNATSKRQEFQKETAILRESYSRLSSAHSSKMGEVSQLQKQIQSITEEIKRDYEHVEDEYYQEYLKLQTKMFISNDISVYSKGLDNAVMKYHSIKMEEINRIIDELWKRTYSGTDVDTIMIKSDMNTQVKGNRSYNYRVVMMKEDVELDMRGRCSAGQKVLASIIIRLALAECFGVGCGMIALDEPTTNLDEENIESLAKALNSIIHLRMSQKNFQLIVITHDEHFLRHMNATEFCDHFFRISRNERQKSQISMVKNFD